MPLLEHRPGLVGADEAGRGPLAGPVVAAAVRLPDDFNVEGLNDSKKLDSTQRDYQFDRIRAEAEVSIGIAEIEEIDRLNILHASEAALARAVMRLNPVHAAVDGHRIPPGIDCDCIAVVKGDGKLAAIAAASIIAKVTRDRIMVEMAAKYPSYGFDRHFGYPTPEHLSALRTYGPCEIHRRSFGPVREALEQPCLIEFD